MIRATHRVHNTDTVDTVTHGGCDANDDNALRNHKQTLHIMVTCSIKRMQKKCEINTLYINMVS